MSIFLFSRYIFGENEGNTIGNYEQWAKGLWQSYSTKIHLFPFEVQRNLYVGEHAKHLIYEFSDIIWVVRYTL